MKITTSHSALKNKLFLGFWFILFATVILFVTWIFSLPAGSAEKQRLLLTETENQITRLTSLHAEFLLGNDKEDNLFSSTGSESGAEINRITGKIRENISTLKDYNRIERKAAVELEDFMKTLTGYESAFFNLILITNERGNKSTGMVSRWLNESSNMLNASSHNDPTVKETMNRIKVLESEYLINRDVRLLQEISILAEDLRNISGTTDYGISITDLDSYIALTANLVSIEKRMGHNESQGIVPEIENTIEEVGTDFVSLDATVEKILSDYVLLWTILKWLTIPVIVFLFVLIFIRYFALIDPLKKIADFTTKLSLGEFPQTEMKAGNHADMKVTIESLRRHAVSLQEKSQFIRALNNDHFDSTLSLPSDKDELGNELLRLQKKIMDNNQKQARNEEDNLIRRYMNEGLAKFADVLRTKNNGIAMLGDAFIRELVKYLNALQGGLFIYDDSNSSDKVLNLVSSFAYNRKKYLQQSVKFGEGLVGSCAREKHFMNITEIPKGYITITSGLGDTPPDNLLLVPVMHENEVLGVLEIASLQKFRKHEIEFAQEVAYNLGSTLVTTRNNQRTAELLEKSQQQALEMAEQEEEMRQNMEELKATQEESNRREEELSGMAVSIESTLMVVEYNLEGTILRVNENICHFLGKYPDEIIGKLHHEVFEGSLKTDAAFWNELQQKGKIILSENLKIGKKSHEISEHFATITNRDHATVKFINFATNGRIGNS